MQVLIRYQSAHLFSAVLDNKMRTTTGFCNNLVSKLKLTADLNYFLLCLSNNQQSYHC